MVTMQSEPAIIVEDLSKCYGRGANKLSVLSNLNMTVMKGAIYGLLGPSGCGKTTLLQCILGRLDPNEGLIKVMGRPPGSVGHGIPGRLVGYMPQDLSLFTEFTISETCFLFGRLNGMSRQEIRSRIDFLIEFLNLPSSNKIISQLSGGQQRRSSFAVALLHEPPLLILDEPTVGVDPLLRARIWNHLLTVSRSTNTTIVITTHYIEEARQASQVGLMRHGKLLAEDSPANLIRQSGTENLEDVFFNLCQREDDDVGGPSCPVSQFVQKFSSVEMNETTPLLSTSEVSVGFSEKITLTTRVKEVLPSPQNILGLIIKNLTIMTRKIGFLCFQFLLPSLQITMFCLCIGQEPFDLHVAVANNETGGSPKPMASTLFLKAIDNRTLILNYFTDTNEAFESVRAGNAWAVISIAKTFTSALKKRYEASSTISNKTLHDSAVHLWQDSSNQQISLAVLKAVTDAFQKFSSQLLPIMHRNPALAQLPVTIEKPIYGFENPSFMDFMAPGIILSITFFMATGLTALAFVIERKQGLLDRCLVAGVSPLELMISHICTQLLVMIGQVAILLVVALAAFKVPCEGPLALVVLLTVFQGFTGMALGMLISSLCHDESSAIQLALGSVYPNMLLSGIIWPSEAMPVWLRTFTSFLPMTLPTEALRSILARGWSLNYTEVWLGFVISLGWGFGLLLVTVIIMKMRQV